MNNFPDIEEMTKDDFLKVDKTMIGNVKHDAPIREFLERATKERLDLRVFSIAYTAYCHTDADKRPEGFPAPSNEEFEEFGLNATVGLIESHWWALSQEDRDEWLRG